MTVWKVFILERCSMKKHEFKTRMVVQLRDGWRGLVLKDCGFYFPFANSSG